MIPWIHHLEKNKVGIAPLTEASLVKEFFCTGTVLYSDDFEHSFVGANSECRAMNAKLMLSPLSVSVYPSWGKSLGFGLSAHFDSHLVIITFGASLRPHGMTFYTQRHTMFWLPRWNSGFSPFHTTLRLMCWKEQSQHQKGGPSPKLSCLSIHKPTMYWRYAWNSL